MSTRRRRPVERTYVPPYGGENTYLELRGLGGRVGLGIELVLGLGTGLVFVFNAGLVLVFDSTAGVAIQVQSVRNPIANACADRWVRHPELSGSRPFLNVPDSPLGRLATPEQVRRASPDRPTGQLFQRCNVIEYPHAAAVRSDHEIVVSGLYANVIHWNRRKSVHERHP